MHSMHHIIHCLLMAGLTAGCTCTRPPTKHQWTTHDSVCWAYHARHPASSHLSDVAFWHANQFSCLGFRRWQLAHLHHITDTAIV